MNKKQYIIAAVCLVVALMLGYGIKSMCSSTNIATIDMEVIVRDSQMFKDLQAKRTANAEELRKLYTQIQTELQKAKTDKKKEQIAKKYETQLREAQIKAQEADKKDFEEADSKIRSIIKEVAADNGCEVTLAKSYVLSGGIDITEEVMKKAQ